jgi:hypothetical protein
MKHISVIAYASTAGESLTLYIVASQDSVRVQEQLKKHGTRLGTGLILKSNRTPYVNAEIFADCTQAVFLLNRTKIWSLDDSAGEFAMLLMEQRTGHATADVIGLLTEECDRVIIYAPHTTQIYQILDATLFGVLRRHSGYELSFEDQKRPVNSS